MKCLFEDYENQPQEITEIIQRYQDNFGEDLGEMDYKDAANMCEEMEAIGYTFDFGLDNEPFGLRPIGTKLQELEGFED